MTEYNAHYIQEQHKRAQLIRETYIDMEGRLGVKVAALPSKSVLMVNIITNILQDLAQVLTPRHCHCTFLWTLSYTTYTHDIFNLQKI